MQLPVIIQARMTSSRLAGKVLRPLGNDVVLGHQITALQGSPTVGSLVLATSDDPSDDPLARWGEERGLSVYRGSLADVAARFAGALESFNSPYFARYCSDRPFFDVQLLEQAVTLIEGRAAPDLVTNVFPPTFPKGQTTEIVRTQTFLDVLPRMNPAEREHVTQYFYRHPGNFSILNVVCPLGDLSAVNMCIDTIEDLAVAERVYAALEKPIHHYSWSELLPLFRTYGVTEGSCAA